jgi:uncharacterized protein YggE
MKKVYLSFALTFLSGTKRFVLLVLLGAAYSSPLALHAQVQGNNQYNSPQPSAGNSIYNKGGVKGGKYGDTQYYNANPYALPDREPASAANITNPNVVSININGLMNIVAADYVAVFNIVQVGTEITETDDLMNGRIKLFKHKLQMVGIDSSKIKVDMISFVPKYDIAVENKLFSKLHNEVPAGFELQKNVMVHFRQSGKIDDIVTAAAQAEIYDLVKVDYFIPDQEKSYDSLMNACVAEVKERVKHFETLGFELDTVRKAVADNFATVFPMQRYYAYQAFSRPSIPASRKGNNPVKLNEADKNISRYYNQVEVDRYDVVLNPLVTEPVVQFSYSIHVQYFINETKPQPPAKNNYYIILESGEVKQVFPGK